VATRRDHGRRDFIDLRDASGSTCRCFCADEGSATIYATSGSLPSPARCGYGRKATCATQTSATGEVEVVGDQLVVLNEAAALPFQVDGHVEVAKRHGSSTDIWTCAGRRRGRDQLRSEVNRAARDVLYEHRFVEIETPTLTARRRKARGTSSSRPGCAR